MNNYEASDNRLSFPHKTIFEQENCDPGLALTEHNGDLYLVWADGDKVLKVAHHLEKVSNGHLVDKVDLGEKSKGNPALASFNGHLYLAWADQNGTLNMMYGDEQTFNHINMPPEISAHGPDLTVYNGNLYIAWTSDKLHGPIHTSALQCARVLMEGDEITGLTAIPLGSGLETSPQAPALASFNGRLYLAWV